MVRDNLGKEVVSVGDHIPGRVGYVVGYSCFAAIWIIVAYEENCGWNWNAEMGDNSLLLLNSSTHKSYWHFRINDLRLVTTTEEESK